MDLKKKWCDNGIHFGKLLDNSVKIGIEKKSDAFRKRRGIPLAVAIMTTANGIHTQFSGRRPKYFDKFLYLSIFTDLRSLPNYYRLLLP